MCRGTSNLLRGYKTCVDVTIACVKVRLNCVEVTVAWVTVSCVELQ